MNNYKSKLYKNNDENKSINRNNSVFWSKRVLVFNNTKCKYIISVL